MFTNRADSPPEQFLQVRNSVIIDMLSVFYIFFNRVYGNNNCKARPATDFWSSHRDCCHALHLGLLIQAYQPLGHAVPQPKEGDVVQSSANIFHSAVDVYHLLGFIKFVVWNEEIPYQKYKSHIKCSFTDAMKTKMKKAYRKIGNPGLDSHRVHMQTQWEKGNPEPYSEDESESDGEEGIEEESAVEAED
jgi:hypothetical protein